MQPLTKAEATESIDKDPVPTAAGKHIRAGHLASE
jgi:hypothetical protein